MGGFSIHTVELMRLTQRKSDCEYRISLNAMEIMALTREQSELSQEYYSRLQGKNIAYYANGKYNQMDYGYLMGYSCNTLNTMETNPNMLKSDYSMVLTDMNGLVVMNNTYANVMKKVLGASCLDADGRGGTFSTDKIPAMIAEMAGAPCTEDKVKDVIEGGTLDYSYVTTTKKTGSQEVVSTGNVHDASDTFTSKIESIVKFFYPIFMAAASNGWTTEYNREMESSDSNYISDALVSGVFNLEQVDTAGNYKPDASLSYFTTAGLVLEKTDSSVREAVTAWYNAQKEELNEKETWLNMQQTQLSTELEVCTTEIQQLEQKLQDDVSSFEIKA